MDKSGKSYIKIDEEFFDDGFYVMTDCLKHFAKTKADQEAFVFADYNGDSQYVTFAELYRKSTSVARSLVKLGVRKGEIVAINLRSCPEWLYLQFGVMFAGAIPASISFTYKDGSDLIALMKKLGKCCLLALDPGVDGLNWDIVKNLLSSYSADGRACSEMFPNLRYVIGHEVGEADVRKMVGVKTIGDLLDESDTAVTFPAIDRDDVAFLLQTSGSTGVPKLVVHTHRSIMSIRQLASFGFLDSSVVQYNDRPFCWIGGYPMSVMAGQKRVTVSGFCSPPEDRVASLIDIVQREKCTLLTALPPLLHGLIRSKNIPEDWPVVTVLTGGQPLTKSIGAALGKVAPNISANYGATEFLVVSSGVISDVDDFREYYSGNICRVPGLEIKVVDESKEIVPLNKRGELYIRCPGMFKEYYNDREKTAAVLSDDGWFKTDDIGIMTEEAELFIYGRISNMIISGGMNVTPEIIEQAMKNCPGVATVVIVPVPDDVYYQVLCACVIRKPGSNITEEELRRYCNEIHNDSRRMFTVLPKYYMFFEEFPETITGKTNRVELRRLATEAFGSS